jgi:Ser/Thr protein kinase RdoA (MazF antagonist)
VESLSETGSFTPIRTRFVLTEACKLVRLDASEPTLIRLGENALYRLSTSPVVVRIARSMKMLNDVRKEMRVAQWLADYDYPAVRLAAGFHEGDMPLIVDSHPVTFWQFVESVAAPRPDATDLGHLLRRLHDLSPSEHLALPRFEPMARVEERLKCPPAQVAGDDVELLRDRFHALKELAARLDYQLPAGPIHGDAHTGNLLRRSTGEVVLLDFEAFCWGPREWDLSLMAGYRYGFEWLSDREYANFTRAYGYDVAEWSGFPILRAVREIGMTTWLMQLAGHDADQREEFERRVDDIRHDRYPRRWRPF